MIVHTHAPRSLITQCLFPKMYLVSGLWSIGYNKLLELA